MPVVDSIKATRPIRAMPRQRGRVSVVALTADATTGAKEYCLAARMDDSLPKPIGAAARPSKLAALVPGGSADGAMYLGGMTQERLTRCR